MAWCILCVLTLASVGLIQAGWFRRLAAIVIILIAAAKSRIVMVHYMEVRRAAKHWRFLYETWIFAVTATIVIGYVLTLKPSE